MLVARLLQENGDADGNPVGRADTIPVKDSCTYEVQFPDGEVTELTANFIAELMYTSCD